MANAATFLGRKVYLEGSITDFRPQTIVSGNNGQIVRVMGDGQLWRVSFTLVFDDKGDAGRTRTDYIEQLESTGRFTETMLQEVPMADLAEISTSAKVAAGTDSIPFTPSATIPEGRYVTFAGHRKVYVVKASQAGRISIRPTLRREVASGAQIHVNDGAVKLSATQPDDSPPSNVYPKGGRSVVNLDLIEDWM